MLEAEHIILAAGSKPLILPIPGMDLPGVLTSDELFRMKSVPESLTIIGGGGYQCWNSQRFTQNLAVR